MNPFLEDSQSENPFFDGIVPSSTLEDEELNILNRVNDPDQETPEYFGLTEIPRELSKGFEANIRTSFRGLMAGQALQIGEAIDEKLPVGVLPEDMTDAQRQRSLAAREYFKGLSGGLKDASERLFEKNRKDIETLGLIRPDSTIPAAAFDVGGAVGSFLPTLGATILTRNPIYATAYFAALQDSDTYKQARDAGKTPEEARAIAAKTAGAVAAIEQVGGHFFLNALQESPFIKRAIARAAGQGAEEAAQTGAEGAILDAEGVKLKTWEEITAEMGYSFIIGTVASAPITTSFTALEERAKKAGATDAQARQIADNLTKNKDDVMQAAERLIDNETAGIADDAPAKKKTLEAVNELFAERQKIDDAIASGETTDPKIAAKVMLESADLSEAARQAIEQIQTKPNFTMEELQAALPKEDVMLAEALALEQKQSATLKESLDNYRTIAEGVKRGAALTKQQVKETQKRLIEFINASGLPAADKGKFLTALVDTQTSDQLIRRVDEIEARLNKLIDEDTRRTAIGKLKRKASQAKDSGVIAVDFANQIQELVNEIDLSKRQPATLKSLQSTLDFMDKNPDTNMPKSVLKKLQILNKKKIEDVTTEDLQSLSDTVDELIKQGKTKLKLLEAKKEREKQRSIDELQKSTVKLADTETKRPPIGERISAIDSIKNSYTERKNRLRRIGVATNPMDVFFDMLDGGKSYKGANHRIFKQTVDKSFSRYQNLKESVTRDVKNLADKLNLSQQSFEKIGAWAVLQQEGGKKKLLDSGYSEQEIDAVRLNESETKMYRLMRIKLDEMLPAIKETMRVVYNKDVEGVSDYFPFMTDHEAMGDFEIQDMLGDNVPSIAKKKNVERGFTLSRTGGKQAVRIDALGVFLKHVDNAAYLVEMGGDIKRLGDIAASKEYGEAAGNIGQEMVVEWVDILARKGNRPGRIHAVDTLRRNVGFAMLGYKLSTILIQPTALFDGASLVGGRYVSRGVLDVATNKAWRQFLWDNFPEVRERAGDDPAYLDMGGGGKIEKVRQAGFWALKNVDALVASSVAAGAYTKALAAKGRKVDFSSPDPDAIAEAQLMMRRTQASAFAKDAPAITTQGTLTGNVSLDRLLLQFQTFMLNRWSLIKHDMWALGVRDGNFKQALNVATWIILANAAEIGLRRLNKELIAALTGDDIDDWEETIEKEAMITALGNVPFVSQTVSAFEYGDVPVPAIGAITQITKRLNWAAASEDNEQKIKHLTSAIIVSAGVLGGVPGTMQTEQLFRKALKED